MRDITQEDIKNDLMCIEELGILRPRENWRKVFLRWVISDIKNKDLSSEDYVKYAKTLLQIT